MGPDLAPGMMGGGGREEIAKLKTYARSSVLLHLVYNGGKIYIFLSASLFACILCIIGLFVYLFEFVAQTLS